MAQRRSRLTPTYSYESWLEHNILGFLFRNLLISDKISILRTHSALYPGVPNWITQVCNVYHISLLEYMTSHISFDFHLRTRFMVLFGKPGGALDSLDWLENPSQLSMDYRVVKYRWAQGSQKITTTQALLVFNIPSSTFRFQNPLIIFSLS